MSWLTQVLYKESMPAMDTAVPVISPQEAHDTCFGPWYHGTSYDKIDLIKNQGFRWDEGEARSNQTSHGYENREYGTTGCIVPVHHLGYGIYLTSNKNIAKDFGFGSSKNIVELYILKRARMTTINFGSPNTMMKWWIANGYNCDLAKINRVSATKALTRQLSSQYDCVYYKGKGLYRLLDGDQMCVYNPSILRMVDKKLIQRGQIGSKVIKIKSQPHDVNIPVGTKGVLVNRRVIEPQYQEFHPGESEWVRIKWHHGGTTDVYGSQVEFL